MAQVLGYKSKLVVDFETTFGSDPAAPAGLILPFNSFNLKSNRPKRSANTIRGSRNPVKPWDGNLTDSGEAQIPVDAEAFGYWLKGCFGAPTSTGITGGTQHVFKVLDAMPSMVMEVNFSTAAAAVAYAHHNGVKVSSLGLNIGGDDELVARFGLEAQKETINTSAYDGTPTAITLDRFNSYQASILEGGATIANCTEMSFDINFGLNTDLYVIGGGGVRGGLPEGLLSVTGNITALFEDTTLLDKAINSTESSIELSFTSGNKSLTISFPEVQFERSTPGVEGPQGVMITLPFVAYQDDDAAESAVICTLVNETESYA